MRNALDRLRGHYRAAKAAQATQENLKAAMCTPAVLRNSREASAAITPRFRRLASGLQGDDSATIASRSTAPLDKA